MCLRPEVCSSSSRSRGEPGAGGRQPLEGKVTTPSEAPLLILASVFTLLGPQRSPFGFAQRNSRPQRRGLPQGLWVPAVPPLSSPGRERHLKVLIDSGSAVSLGFGCPAEGACTPSPLGEPAECGAGSSRRPRTGRVCACALAGRRPRARSCSALGDAASCPGRAAEAAKSSSLPSPGEGPGSPGRCAHLGPGPSF